MGGIGPNLSEERKQKLENYHKMKEFSRFNDKINSLLYKNKSKSIIGSD